MQHLEDFQKGLRVDSQMEVKFLLGQPSQSIHRGWGAQLQSSQAGMESQIKEVTSNLTAINQKLFMKYWSLASFSQLGTC